MAFPTPTGWMGRMCRRCFIPTASCISGLSTSPKASTRGRAQCNSAVQTQFGIKPYSAMLGTLKMSDEVEVRAATMRACESACSPVVVTVLG